MLPVGIVPDIGLARPTPECKAAAEENMKRCTTARDSWSTF